MGAEVGTSALIGGIVSGIGALAGGIATGVGASSAARTSSSYASQMHEDDMKFATDMKLWDIDRANEVFGMENAEYDRRLKNQTEQQKELLEWLQKNFNSPAAQAKALRAAGLSPSVLYGTGNNPFGSIGVPEISAPSSPSISSQGIGNTSLPAHLQPQFNNVGAGIGQGISSAAQVAAQTYDTLVRSNQTDEQTRQLKASFGEYMKGLQLKNASQETKNAFDQLTLKIAEKFKDKQAAAELNATIAAAYNAYMSGDNQKADAAVKRIQKNMLSRKDYVEGLAYSDIQFWVNNFIDSADLEVRLKRAQVATEEYKPTVMRSQVSVNTSQAALNYAMREWYGALTTTENALRAGRVDALEISNDLGTLQKYLLGNDLKFSDATLAARTGGFLSDMNTKYLNCQIAQEELYRIQKQNNWVERQEFADYCLKWSYCFNAVASNFTTLRGQDLRYDVGKERNAFQHEFNQMWRETKMSDVKAATSGRSSSKGVGSILDHVPDADRGYYEGMWKPY